MGVSPGHGPLSALLSDDVIASVSQILSVMPYYFTYMSFAEFTAKEFSLDHILVQGKRYLSYTVAYGDSPQTVGRENVVVGSGIFSRRLLKKKITYSPLGLSTSIIVQAIHAFCATILSSDD